MRYLGIDPGTTIIGYGIIEDVAGTVRCLEYGVIRNDGRDTLHDKQVTFQRLGEILAQFKPDMAGVERLFFLNNKKSAMAVGEMRGVIMLALAGQNIPVVEPTPMQVKQQICGHGGAEKKQVQKMVRMLLHIKEDVEPDDAADALAIALYCSVAPKQY